MTVSSIRIHEGISGAALYSYGDGEFKVESTNALPQSEAHINSTDHGWTVSGSDAQSNGFTTTLPADFIEDNAEIVNGGCFEVEWIGTGVSEQTQHTDNAAAVQGDQVDYGAWVYLESTAGDRNVQIKIQSKDSSGNHIQQDKNTPISVTPGEWTLLTDSHTMTHIDTAQVRIVIDQSGNQTVGDKLYIGMAFINVNANDAEPTPRPSTLMDKQFRLTTTLQQIGGTNHAGTIAQSLSGDWQVNAGFDGNYATINYVNDVGGNAYSVTTGIELDVDEVYEIEILHVYSTGLFELALFESGKRRVVHTETLTTTTGLPPLESYGLDIMPDNWGVLYDLAIYDSAEVQVAGAPVQSLDIYTDNETQDSTPVSTVQQATAKNNLVIERDMFEVSRNFTGTVEFSIPKSDRPELDFSGDFFVACGIQTRNDAAVDIVASHSGTQGWRLSTVAGPSPAQEWEAVFNDGTNNISRVVNTTINDGKHHFLAVERESGVQYDLYSDDIDTPAQTMADTLGSLDGATSLDILSEWQGAFGALVVFTRVFTEEERLILGDWLEYGAQFEATPDFVFDAALYINPSAPVQRDAILDRRLVNLAHRPTDTLWVRYSLTSDDGAANPSLDSMHLEIPSTERGFVAEKKVGPLELHEGWIFSGVDNIKIEQSPTARQLNTPSWTFATVFTKTTGSGEEEIFSDATWRLFHDGTSFVFEHGGTPVDTTAHTIEAGKTYLVTLKRATSDLEVSVNGVTISSFALTFSNVTPSRLEFGKNLNAVVHNIATFDRYLRPNEELAVISALEESSDFSESIAVSETFDYVELNWG